MTNELVIFRDGKRYLPEEILREMLLYLNAKDLYRYKTVSNHWYTMISYPSFINAHLNIIRSRQQPEEIFIQTTTKVNNYSVPHRHHQYSIINQEKMMMKQEELQIVPYCYMLSLQASCDGLLLFQEKFNPKLLYIYNPVTSMFKTLPSTSLNCQYWALVYDTVMNKYKVFGILSQDKLVVLTLEEKIHLSHWDFWPIEVNYHLQNFRVLSQIILFQNELHWLTTDQYNEPGVLAANQECYCIYSVNIETMIFNKIKIPPRVVTLCDMPQFSRCQGLHLLSEVKGSLCLTTVSQSTLEMFVLQDKFDCLWTKFHKICLQSLWGRPPFFYSFLSDNICVVALKGVDSTNLLDLVKVLIHYEDQLLLYDLKSHECRKTGVLKKNQKLCRTYLFHSNSLVSWD